MTQRGHGMLLGIPRENPASMQRIRAVADTGGMTPPRQIHPGQLCFVTARAVNRCHRFAPNPRALELIWYCFAVTLSKYHGRIDVHEFLWMSNHYHLVLTDTGGCLPRFMEELNSLLARAINSLYGIQGTTIEKGYNLVAVATDDKIIEHSVYTLANPCSAHLVEHSHHWLGVSSRQLDYGRPLVIKRPNHGLWRSPDESVRRTASREPRRASFRGRSKLPEEVELVLTRPRIRQDLSDRELRRHVRELLQERERLLINQRRVQKQRVLGWALATKVSFWAAPEQSEDLFGLVPTFSAHTKEMRISAWKRRCAFLEQYYVALRKFLAGDWTAMFPAGTWLMRVRFRARCGPLPVH